MANMLSREMGAEELQEHILATYLSLRIGIAVLGAAFPFILAAGGYFYAHLCLQNSMSAYYHASVVDDRSMRNWFVGLLFAEGVFLYLYKGYSKVENYLLNAAGVLAVGVAVFPMPWNNSCDLRICSASGATAGCPGAMFTIHGFCAITFFLCIALVCFICAGDTLPLIDDEKTRLRLHHTYRVIGLIMILSMAAAWALNTIIRNGQRTFYVEAVGIMSFAAYWFAKSLELKKTAAERKAVHGHLRRFQGRIESTGQPIAVPPRAGKL